MNLNKAGFDAKNVDGIWGDETREALRNLQEFHNLPGNGEPNQQTLSALGVKMNNQAQTTGSQPSGSQSASGQPQGQSGQTSSKGR
jgi:peptidoglycan hydrolase-like protein with peptidoglycan-binding domain